MTEEHQYDSIIEGILFAMGEPVTTEQLAFALNQDLKSTEQILASFMTRYNERVGGMRIIAVDDAYQMTSNPEIFEYLIRVAKQPRKFLLTQATLETLAIVAYRQPVTKLEIEKIRGVKSDYMVGRLMEYGFIEEVGRAETVGRPILFATTKAFLRHFGLRNLEELRLCSAEHTAEFEAAMRDAENTTISEEEDVPSGKRIAEQSIMQEDTVFQPSELEPINKGSDSPMKTMDAMESDLNEGDTKS